MKRIYLDANVFISLINAEIDPKLRGLFVEAENFIDKVSKQESVLVLSNLFFYEVKNKAYYSKEEVLDYFDKRKVKTETVEEKELSLKEFHSRGIHYPDSMHVATAIKQKCNCIVTFNIKDFEKANDKIKVLQPSEFY